MRRKTYKEQPYHLIDKLSQCQTTPVTNWYKKSQHKKAPTVSIHGNSVLKVSGHPLTLQFHHMSAFSMMGMCTRRAQKSQTCCGIIWRTSGRELHSKPPLCVLQSCYTRHLRFTRHMQIKYATDLFSGWKIFQRIENDELNLMSKIQLKSEQERNSERA